MGNTIGNMLARARGTKASASVPAEEAPAKAKEASASAKTAASGEAGKKPGADAPEHLHDSQPGSGQKTSWMDKLSAVGNLGMAVGSLAPLFQSHKEDKSQQPAPQTSTYESVLY
jgi:hypothetical protein